VGAGTALPGFSEVFADTDLTDWTKPTIVRIRGTFNVDATAAAGNLARGVFGIKLRELGLPISTRDNPADTTMPGGDGSDWIVWEPFTIFASATFINMGDQVDRYFDSRGMRRILNPENTAVCVVVGLVPTSSSGVNVEWRFRVLFKGD
jgi:hypothetical protein